jgi:hypothetical protein
MHASGGPLTLLHCVQYCTGRCTLSIHHHSSAEVTKEMLNGTHFSFLSCFLLAISLPAASEFCCNAEACNVLCDLGRSHIARGHNCGTVVREVFELLMHFF